LRAGIRGKEGHNLRAHPRIAAALAIQEDVPLVSR
jgi:hypothetical protein